MKIKELFEGKEPKKIPPTKPRNFVAKNATTSGAGAHKNKKKAMKQGDVKHKGKIMAEGYNLGGLEEGKYYLHSIYMDSDIFTDPESGEPMSFDSYGEAESFLNRLSGREVDEYQVSIFNKGQLLPVDENVAGPMSEAEPVPGKYSGHFYDAKILPNGDYQIVKINSKKDNDGKTNPLNLEVGAVIPKGKAYSLQYTYDGGMFDELNRGIAGGSLNEFAPGKGSSGGRWYNDSDIAAIVGNGWYEEMDVSGDAPKQRMLQQAQEWLESQGYTVDVLDCKINDDDMDWYISGTFDRQGVAEKGI